MAFIEFVLRWSSISWTKCPSTLSPLFVTRIIRFQISTTVTLMAQVAIVTSFLIISTNFWRRRVYLVKYGFATKRKLQKSLFMLLFLSLFITKPRETRAISTWISAYISLFLLWFENTPLPLWSSFLRWVTRWSRMDALFTTRIMSRLLLRTIRFICTLGTPWSSRYRPKETPTFFKHAFTQDEEKLVEYSRILDGNKLEIASFQNGEQTWKLQIDVKSPVWQQRVCASFYSYSKEKQECFEGLERFQKFVWM